MDCRTTSAHKFRTRLGFKQYHIILTKHELVVTKIMSSFEGENMQTQNTFLSYRIDLYFLDYKLAIETDENEHSDRIIDYEKKTKSNRIRRLGCNFSRIYPGKEEFDIFTIIIKIYRYVKQSTKKALILRLRFKSDNIIKSKAIKFIVKKVLPDYK